MEVGKSLQEESCTGSCWKDITSRWKMAAGSYIIAMTGPGDTNEGLQRLVSALVEIDKALSAAERAGGAKRLRRTGQKQFRRGENGFENVYWGRKLQCGSKRKTAAAGAGALRMGCGAAEIQRGEDKDCGMGGCRRKGIS